MFEGFDGILGGGNDWNGTTDGGGLGESPLTGADGGGGGASTNDWRQVESDLFSSPFGSSFDSGNSSASPFGGSFDSEGFSSSLFGSLLDSPTSPPFGEAGNAVSATGFGNSVAAASGSSPFGDFLIAPVKGWNGTPFASLDVSTQKADGNNIVFGGMSADQAIPMRANELIAKGKEMNWRNPGSGDESIRRGEEMLREYRAEQKAYREEQERKREEEERRREEERREEEERKERQAEERRREEERKRKEEEEKQRREEEKRRREEEERKEEERREEEERRKEEEERKRKEEERRQEEERRRKEEEERKNR